jgi:hypothetical protein
MSDWKSVLKEFKTTMLKVKGESNHSDKTTKSRSTKPVSWSKNKQRVPNFPVSDLKVTDSEVEASKSVMRLVKPPVLVRQSVEQESVIPKSKKIVEIRRDIAQSSSIQPAISKPHGVPNSFQIQSQTSLTRQAFFKLPDSWVSDGNYTQLPKLKQSGNAIDIFIGLDFGTSYTKVAVGLKDQIFVVDWQGVSAGADRYLLPSEYSIMADGSCQIGQAPNVPFDQVRQRLKHPLIDAAASTDALANAAVFLALVLRYTRAWIFFNYGEAIGGSLIRWMLNVGVPSNGLESEQHWGPYRKMCSSAWSMSVSESEVSATHACDLIRTWHPEVMPKDLIGLDVLPEFVAQISGYVQSVQRQRGLHALVDVGGGTLDVVTFIVHEQDGEDVFPFLVPEIRSLGTQMLYQNRLLEAPEYEKARLPDELQPVLNSSEYAKCSGLPEEHILQRDKVFWGEVRSTIYNVFRRTKRERYRLSEAWTKGLPVFLTGGGSSVEEYKKYVQYGGQHYAPVMNLMLLPNPNFA